MIFSCKGIAQFLDKELESRIALNASYSLRAFAKKINVAPSSLSAILKGKQGITETKAKQIAEGLNLKQSEKDCFVNLAIAEFSRSKDKRIKAKALLRKNLTRKFSELELEMLTVLSHWYHFAILELTYLSEFKCNPQWISEVLSVPVVRIELALERLKKIGLLKNENGKWMDAEELMSTPEDIPSENIKNLHRQLLKRAEMSLINSPIEERENTSVILAFDKNLVAEAKKDIKDFRNEFTNKYNLNGVSKNAVYCMNINFFDLLNGRKK